MGPNTMRGIFARTTAIVALGAISATSAMAAGLDRSGQPTNAIFAEGRLLELSYGTINPSVTGVDPANSQTGEGPDSYSVFSAFYKSDINDTLSYAIIYDEPYGSDTNYRDAGSIYSGLRTDLNSKALTALMRYKMNGNFSVFGGIKAQEVSATATIPGSSFRAATLSALSTARTEQQANLTAAINAGAPAATIGGLQAVVNDLTNELGAAAAAGAFGDYTIDASSDYSFGYVAGVAYERPEIALRVSLTYHSAIEHENATLESARVFVPSTNYTTNPADAAAVGASTTLVGVSSTTKTEFPNSLNLDFQTGIMADTLLFGRIRHADYKEFRLAPQVYGQITQGGAIASYSQNIRDYSIGIGRRFTENLSGSATVSWQATGSASSGTPISPTNGRTGYAIGLQYEMEKIILSGGVSYTDLGNVTSSTLGTFNDNDAIAIGVRVGFKL